MAEKIKLEGKELEDLSKVDDEKNIIDIEMQEGDEIDGEEFEIKLTYMMRRTTVKMINQLNFELYWKKRINLYKKRSIFVVQK